MQIPARGNEARMEEAVTLRSDLAFFSLDDDLVVFSESAQSLVGLNSAAAFVARKLQEGAPISELGGALASNFAVTRDTAESWAAATLEALGSHGLLDDGHMSVVERPQNFAIAEY